MPLVIYTTIELKPHQNWTDPPDAQRTALEKLRQQWPNASMTSWSQW